MRISDWSSDVCSSDLAHEERTDGLSGRIHLGGLAARHRSGVGQPDALAKICAEAGIDQRVKHRLARFHALDEIHLLELVLEIARNCDAACLQRITKVVKSESAVVDI